MTSIGKRPHRGYRRGSDGPWHRPGVRARPSHVKITDAVAKNLDTVTARIAANLRDLGEDESAAERVTPRAVLAEAVAGADYVVEAVSEDLALKQKLFAEVERLVRPETILASNTSVIPITSIMQG